MRDVGLLLDLPPTVGFESMNRRRLRVEPIQIVRIPV